MFSSLFSAYTDAALVVRADLAPRHLTVGSEALQRSSPCPQCGILQKSLAIADQSGQASQSAERGIRNPEQVIGEFL